MKKIIAFCFLITFSVVTLPASALEGNQVKYLGGTAQGIRGGVIGRLNTTSETELIFEYSGNNLAIPYDAIQSFQSSEEVARHLGVVPAILVGMFKKRQRQHFFRVEYHDSNNVAQALVFEVPKHTPRVLQAVLETRAPEAYRPCRPCANRD
jgi:hypothetical protein